MINKNNRGISLYLTTIMMAILLSVVLGLSTIIISGAKIASNADYNIKAFYAADSGIERALFNIQTISGGTNCDGFSDTFGEDGYAYTVTIEIPDGGTCLDSGTVIRSLGEYNGTKRRIEVSY